MKKNVFTTVVAFALGLMAASLAFATHEVERRPEAVCVPLYDQTGLECWFAAPECPAPKENANAA